MKKVLQVKLNKTDIAIGLVTNVDLSTRKSQKVCENLVLSEINIAEAFQISHL